MNRKNDVRIVSFSILVSMGNQLMKLDLCFWKVFAIIIVMMKKMMKKKKRSM